MEKRIVIIGLLATVVFIIFYCIYSAFSLQLNEAYIKKVIEEAQKKFNVPAVTVNIMDSNQILYSVYNGVRVTGTSEYVTEEDYFHIGSCSKIVLAYIAANLVEENAIDWDTKFFDLYPEFKTESREEYYDITLEDLLTWTAGIQPYTSGEEAYPELPDSNNQKLAFAQYLLQLEPSANRNDAERFEYLYSNASYSIANVMLEKVSGLSYEDLLDKYIVKALDLELFIGWPYQINKDQPWGHFQHTDKSLEIIGPDVDYALNPLINAAGNLSMKSEDFAKFIQFYMRDLMGDNTHLKSENLQYIHSKIFDYKTLQGKFYAYFDGSAGTFYARGLVIPESDFGLSIIINSGSAEAVEYITTKLAKAQYKLWWRFWE